MSLLLTDIQYQTIKMGNYDALRDFIENNFIIKCHNIKINDDNAGKPLNDGTFFGIMVVPQLTNNVVKKVYNCNYVDDESTATDQVLVKSFDIEIDTRIFELLNNHEFYTYIAYEINKYQNIESTLSNYYEFITLWCAQSNIEIKRSEKMEVQLLYYFMCRDYIMNKLALSTMSMPSTVLDYPGVDTYNLDEVDALSKKIKLHAGEMTLSSNSAEFLTVYLLSVMDNIDRQKDSAIKYLNITMKGSSSVLMNAIYKNIIDCLNKITQDSMYIVEGMGIRSTRLYLDFKKSGAKRLESKLYEITVDVKSITDKEDALVALREVNTSIKILDALLSTPGIDNYTMERYDNLRTRYIDLREEIINNKKLLNDVNIVTMNDLLNGSFRI